MDIGNLSPTHPPAPPTTPSSNLLAGIVSGDEIELEHTLETQANRGHDIVHNTLSVSTSIPSLDLSPCVGSPISGHIGSPTPLSFGSSSGLLAEGGLDNDSSLLVNQPTRSHPGSTVTLSSGNSQSFVSLGPIPVTNTGGRITPNLAMNTTSSIGVGINFLPTLTRAEGDALSHSFLTSAVNLNSSRLVTSPAINPGLMTSSVNLNNSRLVTSPAINPSLMTSSVNLNNSRLVTSPAINPGLMTSSVNLINSRQVTSPAINPNMMTSSVNLNNSRLVTSPAINPGLLTLSVVSSSLMTPSAIIPSLVTSSIPTNSQLTSSASMAQSLIPSTVAGTSTLSRRNSDITSHQMNSSSVSRNSGSEEGIDHVDGHTLSTVPLSNVGCADSTLLSNLFQDSVTEGFIDFAEINGQQGVLTPVSTVFPNSVFSSASPQYPSSVSNTNYAVLRTPVYCNGGGDTANIYTDSDTSTVFAAGNTIEFPAGEEFNTTPSHHVYTDIVRELSVQDLECISLQQIKAIEIPRSQNTIESNRLEVVWSSWGSQLKKELKSSTWKDMTILAKSNDGNRFEGVRCHKMMLSLISPVINNWIKEIDSQDEEACIFFPDFNNQEIQEFLDILYLRKTEPSQIFKSIIKCLCGENGMSKFESSGQNSEQRKCLNNLEENSGNNNPGIDPMLIINRKSSDASAMLVKQTDLIPSTSVLVDSVKEMKVEEKEDLFKRSQVEIKMEEFVKFEQEEKMLCVQMKNIQCESKFDVEDSSDQPFCIKDFDNEEILKDFGQEDDVNDIIVNTHEVHKRNNCEEENAGNKKAKTNVDNESTNCEGNSNVEDVPNETKAHGSNSGNHKKASNKGVQCEVCQKWLKNRNCYNHHKKLHAEPKFTCDINFCGKQFYSNSNMKAHIDVVHLKKKDFPCDVCGKHFASASILRGHRNHTHVFSKLECTQCDNGTTFKNKKNLKAHMRIFHNEEQSMCPICQKILGNDFKLKLHIKRVHDKEKKFMCIRCGKKFFDKQALLNHAKLHEPSNGEERIQCEICKVVLKHYKSWKHHMTMKHGENTTRKHVCHLCGKAFMTTYHLNRHMKLHTKGGFLCPICCKGFPTQTKLDTHYSATHPKAPSEVGEKTLHKCEHCDKILGENPLVSHIQEHYRTCEVRNFMVDAT